MTCSKRDKMLALTVEDRVSTNKKRIGPLPDKCREDLIEVIFSDRIQDTELDPTSRVGRLMAFKKARKCWVSAPAFDVVVLNDIEVRRALS
jgi:hypothetical protein